jgi:uncharacterized protein (DUF169 family)
MAVSKKDLAILEKFGFERPPVAVKYTFKRPEGIDRLGESATLCAMLSIAQKGNAFYVDKNNLTCGSAQLGIGVRMDEASVRAYRMGKSGEFSTALKVFEAPRTGAKFKREIPLMNPGLINYASFAPLGKISFDPDLMIIFTNDTNQTQILLRAVSWRTAEVWEAKFTNVLGCSWVFVYPYLSGKVNFGLTGLSHGMGRRKIFPDGIQFVVIPYQRLPDVLQALKEVPWVLPSFADDKYFDRTREALFKELPKHIIE